MSVRALLLGVCLAGLLACDSVDVPSRSANLSFHGGELKQWQSLRGQWVFINYWAEWCKPCLKEIPELNALSEVPGVAVLGVNYDGVEASELDRLVLKFGIRFPLLSEDPSVLLSTDRPSVLPATLVYSPAGEFQMRLVGPQTVESLTDVMKKSL